MIMLLSVYASDVLDSLMVGYLLKLFREGTLVGPTMLMWWASMVGFQQTAFNLRVVFDGVSMSKRF
jgi:hypothetical protein